MRDREQEQRREKGEMNKMRRKRERNYRKKKLWYLAISSMGGDDYTHDGFPSWRYPGGMNDCPPIYNREGGTSRWFL